jgi:ribosome-binding factor A
MPHRIEKIQSTMARAVQEVLARGLHDPRAGGLITVTHVDVSPDLRNAVVHVSVLPAEKGSLTVHALEHAARHIRREVGEKMHIKKMPEFTFRLDESLKRQAEVFTAINLASQGRREAEDADEKGDAGGGKGDGA